MLLIFLLFIPIILWLIPLSGINKRNGLLARSFVINFVAMLKSVVFAALIMWLLGTNSTTVWVTLLSISASWGAIFHLVRKR
jgi:hypothetical protein